MSLKSQFASFSSTHGFHLKLAYAFLIGLLSISLFFGLFSDFLSDNSAASAVGSLALQIHWSVAVAAIFMSGVLYLVLTYYRKVRRGFDVEGVVERKGPSQIEKSPFKASEIRKLLYEESGSGHCGDVDRQASELALATVFLTACISPDELFYCIDERVRADSRSLFIESYLTFKIPSNFRGSPFVIPAFFHSRGSYPDSLDVLSSGAGTVTFLNLNESLKYVEQIVMTCLPELRQNKLDDAILAARKQLITSCIRSFLEDEQVMNEDVVKLRNERLLGRNLCVGLVPIRRLLEDYYAGDSDGLKRANLVLLMLSSMVEAFPICMRVALSGNADAVVAKDTDHALRYLAARSGSTTIAISYRLPLVIIPRRGVEGNVCWKGERPGLVRNNKTIYYGLGNADRTQSYHLQVLDSQDAFCSLVAFRRMEPAVASSKRKAKAEARAEDGLSPYRIGFPSAEMAYLQTRREQRHLSLSVKAGKGFSNWFLMFRHEPRFSTSYVLVFVAALLVLSTLMITLFCKPCTSDSLRSIVLTGLSALSAVVLAAVSKSGRRDRGDNAAPLCAALVCMLSSLLLFLNLLLKPEFVPDFLMLLDGGILLAICILVAARFASWALVVMCLRREENACISLLCGETGEIRRRMSARGMTWSAGWIALDHNRYVAVRSDVQAEALAKSGRTQKVRDVFVPLANR